MGFFGRFVIFILLFSSSWFPLNVLAKSDSDNSVIGNLNGETLFRIAESVNSTFLKVVAQTIRNVECRTTACSDWTVWSECEPIFATYGVRKRKRNCEKKPDYCGGTDVDQTDTIAGLCESRCPFGYNLTSNGHCMKLSTEKLAWDDAVAHCEKDGGHLIHVDSKSKSDDIERMYQMPILSRLWMDGIRRNYGDEWTFHSVPKEPGFSYWGKDQPDARENEFPNCISLHNALNAEEWKWWDRFPCSEPNYFICEV